MANRQTTTQNQKQNQQYESSSTYDFLQPPDNADTQALRSHQFGIDPTIGYRVGSAIRRQQDSYRNPMGAYTTPGIRAATDRSFERDIMQEGGAQARAGYYDANQANYMKKLAVASMTQPRMVQTGQKGTSSGTSEGKATTSEPWYNGIAQGAASMGSALIM